MGKFLTSYSRLQQTGYPEKWKLIDNQLYKDDDGTIYLCPRNYITDGFTIPKTLQIVAGSKMEYDTRASSQHDFECSYHKVIIIDATENKLRRMKLLHVANGMDVCEDIPIDLLKIKDTTFKKTNDRFIRMLASVNNIPNWRRFLIGHAVSLNASWLIVKHELDVNLIYKVDYGLLK